MKIGKFSTLAVTLLLFTLIVSTSILAASAISAPITFSSPNSEAYGYFGRTLFVGDGIVVTGAYGETAGTFASAGHAYIYKTGDHWTLFATLTSPNPQAGGQFGYYVTGGDGLVAVSAPGENINAGSVYVFDKKGALLLSLFSPHSVQNGYFGDSVAIGSGVVAVGADGENNNAGNVYIFNEKSGVLITTLTSPNSELNGSYGCCGIVMGEGLLVVTASYETVGTHWSAGHVYIYRQGSYALFMTLTSPNPQNNGVFGSSGVGVAVGQGMIVVGAYNEANLAGTRAGHAYIFKADSGTLIATLNSPNPKQGGRFGGNVAIGEGIVVVGAPREDVGSTVEAGHAYVFNKDGTLLRTLTSPNPEVMGRFEPKQVSYVMLNLWSA